MNIMRDTVYGLISGITEFLPVSSRGHQSLMRYLFGLNARDPMLDLLVHIGILLSVFISCREMLLRLCRHQRVLLTSKRRRSRMIDMKSHYNLRFLKGATLPLLIGLFLILVTSGLESSLLAVMAFMIVNGCVLMIVEHIRHGNRDAKTMSGLDAIAIGIVGATSVLSGISRSGMISAYAVARGADRQNAANWAILLGIPALLFLIGIDVFGIVAASVGIVSFPVFAGYFLAGAAAFCGGYIGISFLQIVLNYFGFSGFAYYSFGTAFFTFVIYLIA